MKTLSSPRVRPFHDDEAWREVRMEWAIRPDTTYLNHGSFGPPPRSVRFVRKKWIDLLDEQPMDFYVRQFEEHILEARKRLARFMGTAPENLVFVENATYGMNVVANSFPLSQGDEVLITNHDYGAVDRIWDRACRRARATKHVTHLAEPIRDPGAIVQQLVDVINEHTKLLVISHITSPTALILPVAEICEAFQKRGISVCIDGPHAPAQLPMSLDQLGCAFYTASLHKWLSAPLGSGFLYVSPYFQNRIEPPIKSWGRLLPAIPERWDEEFTWQGTRDPSPFLSVPTAIEFLEGIGWDQYRGRTFWLAEYAEQQLRERLGTEPIASRDAGFYGSMAHLPLPPGDWTHLQQQLWEKEQIEVPIIHFDNRWFVRVSCHLYNTTEQIDLLVRTLGQLTGR